MIRFRWAVVFSVLAHLGLFSILYLKPAEGPRKGMTYYVDLVNMPGGGDGRPAGGGRGGPGAKAVQPQAPASKVRDLTVAKETAEPDSALRFPDGRDKKPSKPIIKPEKVKAKEPQKMVTVVTRRDDRKEDARAAEPSRAAEEDDPFLRIGVGGEGSGTGSGSGDGSGEGSGRGLGFGPGGPGGGFSYYYAAIQNKIKNAWYNTNLSGGDSAKVAHIACRILRSGEVSDVRIYQGSGDEALDTSGVRAVRRAAPFPPIPAGNPNQYIDVIFEFEGRKR
jgi:protein TonB